MSRKLLLIRDTFYTDRDFFLLFFTDPVPIPLHSKSSPSASQQFSVAASPTCRACSFSSRDEPALMSRDQSAGTNYISTQLPKDQDLSMCVRTACHRSLSCEVIENPFSVAVRPMRFIRSYHARKTRSSSVCHAVPWFLYLLCKWC